MTDDFRNDDEDTNPESNKRKHERVGFYSQVQVATSDENKIDVFADNVSRGGIFLRSDQPLQEGQKLSLNFQTDKGPVEVQEGEVRWNKPVDPADGPGVAGMGVAFKHMEQESSQNIGDFIDEVLANEDATTHVESNPNIREYSPATLVDAAFQQKQANLSKQENMPLQTAGRSRPRLGYLVVLVLVLLIAGTTFWFQFASETQDLNKQRTAPALDEKGDSEAVPSKADGPVASAPAEVPPSDPTNQAQPTQPVNDSTATQPSSDADQNQTQTAKVEDSLPVQAKADQNQKDNPPSSQPAKMSTKQTIMTRPAFVQDKQGWKVDLEVEAATRFKHFTLSQPPRLVVDFFQANWKNETKIRSPVPFIKRARLGNKPAAARLVLDFKGKKVPGFQIDRLENRFTVRFD